MDESNQNTRGEHGMPPTIAAGRGAIVVGLAVLLGILLLQIYDRDGNVAKTVASPAESSSSSAAAGSSSSSDVSGSSTTSTTSVAAGAHTPANIKVSVLNAGRPSGTAKTVSDTLHAAGYATLTPGNTTPKTGITVHCKSDFSGDVAALIAASQQTTAASEAFPATTPAGAPTDASTADCFIILGS